MTLIELRDAINKDIEAGMGDLQVAFGDCNTLHKVSGIGKSFVEDVDTYYLEEVGSEDGGVAIYVIGE